jgi:hypothetical protein
MAFQFDNRLDGATEQTMRDFFATLSEKEQRRLAAFQARQLGHGGIQYVAEVLGCSRRTIERGIKELDDLPNDSAAGRIRRPGAGRPKAITPDSEVEQNLKSVLQTRTGGDPDDATIVFTDLSPARLSKTVTNLGTPVSDETIRQWMDGQNLRLRKIRKVLPGGSSPDRDAQFARIAELIEEYEAAGNPYFFVDTKAKEHLGSLFRAGRVRCNTAFRAFDHDFPSWADGVIIPHGIYDRVRNRGHINIGLSHDTSLFACDSLQWYWNRIGQQCYRDATSVLLLFDCGGSNAANKYIFKHDLQTLADTIGLEIRAAHYPSYCSKYNPIERRLFPHITRACTGMLFDTLETVVELMRKATTSTGLRTTVNVIRRLYETGRNATEEMKSNLKIVFDDLLPKWNYRAVPQNATVIV